MSVFVRQEDTYRRYTLYTRAALNQEDREDYMLAAIGPYRSREMAIRVAKHVGRAYDEWILVSFDPTDAADLTGVLEYVHIDEMKPVLNDKGVGYVEV